MIAIVIARGQGQAAADRFGNRTAIALGVGEQAVVFSQRQTYRHADGRVVGIDTRATDPSFHAGGLIIAQAG